MIVDLDLGDLYKKYFGKAPDSFNPQIAPVSGDNAPNRIGTGALGSPYYATDLTLGNEYFMPVTFTYPSSSTADGLIGAGGESNNGNGLISWQLPFPMISISARKTIIETPLTERNGTVKELINLQDFAISIKGFLIADTNDYPENLVTTLRNLYEVNAAIIIKCPLTDVFLLRPDRSGSDKVVIKEMKLPGNKGVKNVVPYELELVSDEPFSLIEIS